MEVEHISQETRLSFITEDTGNEEIVKGIKIGSNYYLHGDKAYASQLGPVMKFEAPSIGKLLTQSINYIDYGKNAVFCENTEHTFIIDVQPDFIEVTGFYWDYPDEENNKIYDGKLSAYYIM